jgi:hypothetical protein
MDPWALNTAIRYLEYSEIWRQMPSHIFELNVRFRDAVCPPSMKQMTLDKVRLTHFTWRARMCLFAGRQPQQANGQRQPFRKPDDFSKGLPLPQNNRFNRVSIVCMGQIVTCEEGNRSLLCPIGGANLDGQLGRWH